MINASAGDHKRTDSEWASYFESIEALGIVGKMTIDDYMAIPSQRRAVCRSSMTATTPVGPYSNVYVWFLEFDESGEKIVIIEEFYDTKAAGELLGKLKDAGLR